MKELLIQYLNWIILFFVGLLILYIKTLVSERAKNKMLKKYQSELEELKFKHQKELDKLKSEHDLDISKRKYQYESKHSEYVKFFNYLDESSFKTKEYFEKSSTITERFLKNFLNATSINNKKMENNAITAFQSELTKFMMESQEGFIKLKQNSNTIELIAGKNVIDALNDYIKENELVIDISNKVVNEFPKLIITGNQDKNITIQDSLNFLGENIKRKMLRLKEVMREELEYS